MIKESYVTGSDYLEISLYSSQHHLQSFVACGHVWRLRCDDTCFRVSVGAMRVTDARLKKKSRTALDSIVVAV